MNQVLLLAKQVGETPLACIERFRAAHPEYVSVKMTYAGRLDPIAEGLLIVLVGEAVHGKDSYNKLSKVYECVVLLGVSTDTYDVLGVPSLGVFNNVSLSNIDGADQVCGMVSSEEVSKALSGFVGSFQQAYPPYSSKTVGGRQLHQIARAGELETIEIPMRDVVVERVFGVEVREISQSEISRQITDTISRVQGDFRQSEIAQSWAALWATRSERSAQALVQLVSFTIAVSSGTYIRGIVHSLGEKLGTGACIVSLKRTAVGDFLLPDVKNF